MVLTLFASPEVPFVTPINQAGDLLAEQANTEFI